MTNTPPIPLLVWGGAGHAKVLRPIISAANRTVVAVVERRSDLTTPFLAAQRFWGEEDAQQWLRTAQSGTEFVLAIGGHNGLERCRLARMIKEFGLVPFSSIHHTAFIAETASVAPGCHVLAMAAVCEEVRLGPQTIVNTNATVDHECDIGAGVHVMPGATIAGCVRIGHNATVGSNATVLPRIEIGAGAQVGAGAVVTKDVAPGTVVVGVPARKAQNSAIEGRTRSVC